jgi:4'-phosphopantetheinyl transferase EntD
VQLQGGTDWVGLLPASVVAAAADHDLSGPLADEERVAIARAVPSRRAEFRTGRLLARRALTAIGAPVTTLPVGRSGAPRWPEGVVGTITHCPGLRACAVARRDDHAGIGIDATPARPLPPGVLRRIADVTDDRVARGLTALRRTGVESPDSVLLAATEAVAKARSAAHDGWFGIDGAHVELRPDGTFTASARRGPAFAATGRWAVDRGTARAGIVLAAR